MEMTMRWYGKEYDTVTLQQIRQSCYVKGIISTLYNKMPGEVWELDEILALKKDVEDAGLFLAGIESVCRCREKKKIRGESVLIMKNRQHSIFKVRDIR